MKRLDKAYNEYIILDSFRPNKSLSILDIIAQTSLSRPTVDTVIRNLEKDGIVIKDGYAESDTGRRPILWTLNGNIRYFVGIDIELPAIRIFIINMRKEKVLADTFFLNEDVVDSSEHIVEELKNIIKNCFLNKLHEDLTKIASISIGNAGIIDRKTGVSVTMHNCPNWQNVNICKELEEEFNCRIYLENVVLFMANSDREYWCENDKTNFIYISLRSGVGAGVCINGELYGGTMGNAGHFGYIPISNPLFDYPKRLEECTDSEMIIKRMREKGMLDPEYNPTLISQELLDYLTDSISSGNEDAISILTEVADYWAYGIASAVCLLDIGLCVIGGLFAYINKRNPNVGNMFLGMIRDNCQQKYLPNRSELFDLEFAKQVTYSAAYGGALYGYDAINKQEALFQTNV